MRFPNVTWWFIQNPLTIIRPNTDLVAPVIECAKPVADTINAHIWYWDAVRQRYIGVPADGKLEPGRAYWIYAESATILALE